MHTISILFPASVSMGLISSVFFLSLSAALRVLLFLVLSEDKSMCDVFHMERFLGIIVAHVSLSE